MGAAALCPCAVSLRCVVALPFRDPPTTLRRRVGAPLYDRAVKRGVLGTLTVLLLGTLGALGPVRALAADPSPDPLPTTVTMPVAATSTYGRSVQLAATVVARTTDGSKVPVPQDSVTFQATTHGRWQDIGQATTDSQGRARLTVRPTAGWHSFRATAAAVAADPTSTGPLAPGTASSTSIKGSMNVAKATLQLRTAGATIVSEGSTSLHVELRSPTLTATALAHRRIRVSGKSWGHSVFTGGHSITSDGSADVSIRVTTWHGVTLKLSVPALDNTTSVVRQVQVRTRGLLSTVRQGPHPRQQFPVVAAPAGAGAHITSGPVPAAVWSRMVGVSWRRGCPVGRAALRYVQLNYWGFDGYRHRGAIIVNKAIVGDTEGAFRALYDQHFRIRRIQPEDTWGRDPKGPGADDYAAMRADDTSGYNCRYVDGREGQHVWSPHAYGMAIDLNTFENPYVARTGTFPDTYWRGHRRGVGVLERGGAAARAFTSRGFFWGANWSAPDFQHFQQ